MDYSDLKTELADRGFSDLTDTRRGRYINAGRAELDRLFLWPWREKSGTGTAPITITDLGVIESVTNESQGDWPLTGMQWRNLLDMYGDLSTTGTPWAYYRAQPSGSPVVATYPTSTDTIGVQYWKITPDLVDSTDEPESPEEAHYLIVDLAVRRASRDVGDHDGARAVQEEIDRQLGALREQYQPGQADDPGHIIFPTGSW